MVLQQHEAPQFRPEVAGNPGRHRRENCPPIGREPALPADAHDMRVQHQILDDEVLVALEARPGRHVGLDDALLINDQPLGLALLGAALARLVRRLRLGLLLHATWPDRGTSRHALQLGNLRAQVRHRPLQLGVFRQQALGQGLKVAPRQPTKGDLLWNRHAWNKSGPQRADATSLSLIPARLFAPGTPHRIR
jgi:hypothetical protein